MSVIDEHISERPLSEGTPGETAPELVATRRGQVIRTAVILAVAALAVYGGFILLMAERSQG